MTVTPTYPGVYLQEIPSGNRTVTGVATSIAAFVGTAPRGSVDDPVPISGFGDFERAFGGLTRTSGLGYAVRDYFLNGGSDALVVRVVHHKDPAKDAKDVGAVPARLTVDGLTLEASGPGAWGNALHAKVEYLTATVAADVAAGQGVSPNALFILTVSEGMGADAPTETYVNVTTTDGPQRLDLVLASSRLVRVSGTLPTVRPAAGEYDVARLPVDTLPLGPGPDAGPWSGGVKATVTRPTAGDALNEAAKQQGVKATDLFNLALEGTGAKIKEPYDLVTVVDGPRRVDVVLAGSAVARVVGPLPTAAPKDGTYEIAKDKIFPGLDGDPPGAADYIGDEDGRTGMQALRKADLFTILCIPPRSPDGALDDSVWAPAAALCRERRAFLLVDPPSTATTGTLSDWLSGTGLVGLDTRNAALYFPRILRPDPLRGGASAAFAPCGVVAGTYARTDSARGIWKAPPASRPGSPGWSGFPSCSPMTTAPRSTRPGSTACGPSAAPGPSSGAPGPCAAVTSSPTSTSTSRSAAWRYTSRRRSTGTPSGSSSSPTTRRCGRRSGLPSAGSCRACSGRARSRGPRRGMRTSSAVTATPPPSTTSTAAW